MDINLSLIGQIITFLIFVWFTMRYVWPPLRKAMEDRQAKIAEGLAAAERSSRDLELAQHKAVELLGEAKLKASHVLEQANSRAFHIVEEAKEAARLESQRLLDHAQAEIANEYHKAKRELKNAVGLLSVETAEKIIRKDIDAKAHQRLLDDLLAEI